MKKIKKPTSLKSPLMFFFLFLMSLFMFISSGVIDSLDGFQSVEVARNIYYHGEPTGPILKYDTKENIFMTTYIGQDGKTYAHTGLGFSLALVPAVAVTDLVYKIYNVSPTINFPLVNDWLILLTTSFTNSFFGALLGVVLFVYLLSLGLNKKSAFIVSLAGLLTTNLLPYTKHSFAHMMFVSFLTLSFYLLKQYFTTKIKKYLLFSGLSYGVVMISYNQTFLLTIPSLVGFIIACYRQTLSKKSILNFFKNTFPPLLIFILGLIPFLLIYIWFENLREIPNHNLANPTVLVKKGLEPLLNVPISAIAEGIIGQLFSPGRSIFIYSPLLLLILIFWQKINKKILPELLTLLILGACYIFFYATQFSYGTTQQGVAGLWHGESSWGPRYLLPLIPFGILVVGFIYSRLSKLQKIIVFLPLVLIGLYIQLLGVIVPYQTKFKGLEESFYLNSTEYTVYVYGNFLPRYSAVIMQSRYLSRMIKELPNTLNHGKYNVKFYDGIDLPFLVGTEKWRTVENEGYISFDNSKDSQVEKISIGLINHPLEQASYSATIQASLNGKFLKKELFKPTEKRIIDLDIPKEILETNNNQLQIKTSFNPIEDLETTNYDSQTKTTDPKEVSQIIGMYSFGINNQPVNIESIDIPYVSQLGSILGQVSYKNWGQLNKDPWKTWHLHTQTFERLPDFWWFRNLYYWDIPKKGILILFALNIAALIFFGYKTLKFYNK